MEGTLEVHEHDCGHQEGDRSPRNRGQSPAYVPQEKLAVDTGLDGHRHRQSYPVIAPSTRCSSPLWDHFNF